jgi:hypothetical protein
VIFSALVLVAGFCVIALLNGEALQPIGCPACGDPLTDHLQKLELMPDYCPACGWRLA